jgi:hypothetical protein
MTDTLVQNISGLLSDVQRLARQAHAEYSPEVDAVIHEQSRDPKRIERLLDGILDFCFDPEMLRLYKKLCHYYFAIDPEATVSYVNFYRDMWDDDGKEVENVRIEDV